MHLPTLRRALSVSYCGLVGSALHVSLAAAQQPSRRFDFRGWTFGDSLTPAKRFEDCGAHDPTTKHQYCFELNVAIGTVNAGISYGFIDGKLYSISFTFPSEEFETLRSAFVAKYGAPATTRPTVVTNRMGVAFANMTLGWSYPGSTTTLVRYGSTVTEGGFIAQDTRRAAVYSQREAAKNTAAAVRALSTPARRAQPPPPIPAPTKQTLFEVTLGDSYVRFARTQSSCGEVAADAARHCTRKAKVGYVDVDATFVFGRDTLRRITMSYEHYNYESVVGHLRGLYGPATSVPVPKRVPRGDATYIIDAEVWVFPEGTLTARRFGDDLTRGEAVFEKAERRP